VSTHPVWLEDEQSPRPVRSSDVVFQGRVWDVRREVVDLGEAGEVVRDLVDHPGAVAVVALDDEDRVALVQQYRHPVRMLEWEVPAGLLDVDGESPHEAAARELHEEADLDARRWDVLVDYVSSPGGMSEALRVFLARDVSPVPEDERHARTGEELGMPMRWVPLDDVADAVLAGRLHNATLAIGVLAALRSRDRGWSTLRPVDARWASRHTDRRRP
jgi:8-oxo-dGTP pyrophosphatase MutT (NUDIX family)